MDLTGFKLPAHSHVHEFILNLHPVVELFGSCLEFLKSIF